MKGSLLRTIGLKLVHLVPVLFLVSLATFFLLQLVPGDPATSVLGADATPEQYAAVRAELGLNKPLLQRYLDWLGNTLSGDLGRSLKPPVQNVSDMILSRLPVTLEITILAIGMSLLVSIPLALGAAYRANGRFDRITSGAAFAAISVPSFLGGLLIVFFFVFNIDLVRWPLLVGGAALAAWLVGRTAGRTAHYPQGRPRARHLATGLGLAALIGVGAYLLFAHFPDFPRQGFVRWTDKRGILENLRSAFLPSLTLALVEIAIFMRLLRGDLISTLQEDYILSARAKGMPARSILVRDALRPSSFSLITVAGVSLGRLIGGTAIVEAIFNLPGMGTLIIDSVGAKDYRVVQGAVLVVAVFYVIVNAAIDISYSYLDPRIRRGRT
jgi:peptide/nickel transport system permease protein